MARVIAKRPIDVIEHTVDFTGYIPAGQVVASATAKVVGEGDNALTVDAVAVASPLVTLTLSGGTAKAIYQVYVDATMPALVKRLQFEVHMAGDPEGTP